jgi:hypothetical protein
VVHECKIRNIQKSGQMVQSEALAVAKSISLRHLQDGWIVLRGTILCGTESVGNLEMWMKV